ncbi:hypothetical protein NKH77_48430 [Streptomyces sp. M19]
MHAQRDPAVPDPGDGLPEHQGAEQAEPWPPCSSGSDAPSSRRSAISRQTSLRRWPPGRVRDRSSHRG